ncbi:MAG: hypothetical protein ACOVOV_01280 [Dolichospermum sp.]
MSNKNEPPKGIIEYLISWPFEGLEKRKTEGEKWSSSSSDKSK